MTRKPQLPSLAILRCFEAAARYESFSAAAEELGLTQGAVSRHVRELETAIAAPLFQREGRGVRLTVAGEALAQQLARDLASLQLTIAQAVAAGGQRRLLRIAAPPTFSGRWLIPRLPSFRARHPDMELIIQSRSSLFDLRSEKVDLAIHFGGWDWPGVQLTPLCPEDLIVVAAPSLAAQFDPARPELLREMPLLHLQRRPHLWERYFHAAGLDTEGLRAGSYFDQFGLVISAAVAGMGFAVLPTYLIEAELSEGVLLPLGRLPEDRAQSYFIATPLVGQDSVVQDFILWLRGQVSRRPRIGDNPKISAKSGQED